MGTSFLKKCQKAQIPCIPPCLCWKAYDTIILPEVDRCLQEIVNFQFSFSPWEKSFTSSCEFGPGYENGGIDGT